MGTGVDFFFFFQESSIRKNVLFLKKRFIYLFLFMIDTERERGRETQEEGEADSMPGARRGLDLGTPGSRPGPKAGAKPLSHPRIPSWVTVKQSPAIAPSCLEVFDVPEDKGSFFFFK